MPAPRLATASECEYDAGGRFTNLASGDSHRPSRLSAGAATSCGPAARWPVAHERFGPWWERPASPRAWYGFGTMWRFTPRPCPPGVAPAPTIPGGKAVRTPLRDEADRPEPSSGCRRCPNCPRRSPCQRPPAWWLAPATHGGLGPDTAISVCPYAAAPSGFHPPSTETAGSRRPSGLPRVGLPPPCASSGLPAKDCWTRSDPPRRLGMECTSQPPQMPQRASKKVGRYDHGLRFRRGTATLEAVAQPQAGQRLA